MPDPSEFELPLLAPDEWIDAVESSEGGEPLPTLFDGFRPPHVKGRAVILGADTEVGKTAFALQDFRHTLEAGFTGAYCTLEMTPADLFERFSQQFESEGECKSWIKTTGAYVSQSYVDAGEVEQIIRKGFDLVVVDHIHELPFDGHEDLGRKVRRLSSLAPITNTALFLLSQLKRPDPMFPRPPGKHDFAWTQAIEQAASALMALHREDDSTNYVELYNLKNRFGPKYQPVGLELDPRTVTFRRV